MKTSMKVVNPERAVASRSGFTLIELLVVIAIIGILAGMIMIALNSAKVSGKDARVKSNMAQLRSYAEIYAAKNGGNYGCFDYASTNSDCALRHDPIVGKLLDDNKAMGTTEWNSTTSSGGWQPTGGGFTATILTLPGGDIWCWDSRGYFDKATGYNTEIVGVETQYYCKS